MKHHISLAAFQMGLLLCTLVGAGEPTYSPPRTADGKPDLQGVWSNASLTTLERSPRYSALVIPDADVAKVTAEHPQFVRQQTDDGLDETTGKLDGSDLQRGRGYNAFWTDPGIRFGRVHGQYRTSWIVEPSNGKIPYTEQARKYIAALPRDDYDGPEARPLGERCLVIGGRVGPPMVNGLYNNNYQIVQTRDHVVIHVEMIEHARVIRLNARHARGHVRQLFGDSIGWWDGDTLVVETIDFHPLQARSANPAFLSAAGKVTERFTRVAKNELLYEFTVADPEFYSQPWRGELTFNALPEHIYEYACHEGNYALTGVLAGAREEEKRAKLAPTKTKH